MPILNVFKKIINSDIIDANNSSYTIKYQNHFPCSFAYQVVCVDNKYSKKRCCKKNY